MPKRSEAQSTTIAPPIMGWNTKDPISGMDPSYAVEVENFIADGGAVCLRKGTSRFVQVSAGGSFVQGLAEYNKSDGTKYIVAITQVAGNGLPYSVTTGGVSADISGGGLVIVTTVDTSVIFFCNFNDRIFMKSSYSGDDVYVWTGTGNAAAAAFTGPAGDDKALAQISSYKHRLYFCGNDAKVWYGGVDLGTGALTSFDFATVFPTGGQLIYCGSISPNPANNREQFFLAISTSGDILMYSGDYPGNWELVGTYFAGAPIGNQSFIPFQNDLLIITKQGLVSVLSLIGGSALENAYLSDYVGTAFRDYVTSALAVSNPNNIGGVYYPSGNYILIHFRTQLSPALYKQFIFYTLNKSWWLFSGYQSPINWINFNAGLYFSTSASNYIMKADTGYADTNAITGATDVSKTIKLRPAYNYLGDPEKYKSFQEARPILYSSNYLSLTMDADVDYANTTATNTVSDTTSSSYIMYRPRVGLNGIGKAISLRIDGTVTDKQMSLQAMEIIWKEGDIV